MVKYINAQTGKEVQYGEIFTYKEEQNLSKGYKLEKTVTLPIINETIPELIEKGYLVQKEIKEEKKDPAFSAEKTSVEEKLNILAGSIYILIKKVNKILSYYDEDKI